MSILYKNGNNEVVSLIPNMNNIDDSTVAANTTYSSEKIESAYPITSTSTTSPITDSADGYVQDMTVYGRSDVTETGIHGIGESGELEITTANSDNTASTTATVTTGIPLYLIGDVKDELIAPKKVAKRIEKIVLDGSEENWSLYAASPEGPSGSKTFGLVLSTAFINYSISTMKNGATWGATAEYENKYELRETTNELRLRISGVATIEALKSYLASNPVTVVYGLAEPYEIPLTSAELSALRNLRTYSGTTNLTITDDPEFTADYLKNSENGQAVADLQTELQEQIDEVKNTTKPRVYAFYVDQNDSNPAICVHPYYNTKYGCDNLFYQNAYMDYEKDEFNYGSWKDFIYEFFKPCMLAYDGHVDYYLDPDDYETKLDGGTSDIKDMTYNGNVMVQIKKLYFKRWTANGKYYCIISDKKLDKSFKAYAHHDIKGNVLDYIYRAAYDGSYDGTRLRSISGVDYHNANALTANKIMSNTTRQQEINFAKANNDANEQGEGWNILHKSEWDLINDLLLLIGTSTNMQATFGNGNVLSYVSTSNAGIITTGTMDKKGLFYGKNDNISGAKVFGFEHPWGNIWKSCLGWILSANQHLVKMTPGNEDGSTATGYNLDGAGYVATGKSVTANGYISAFDGADTGFLPTAASGSATTYMCDYVWRNTAVYFALVGGGSGNGALCGAFCAGLNRSAADAYWGFGAALSYKPLARG